MSDLHKSRWPVGLLFESIEQHLRVKAFHGTSESVVTPRVWIATPIAIIRTPLKLNTFLYKLMQMFSVTVSEKTSTESTILCRRAFAMTLVAPFLSSWPGRGVPSAGMNSSLVDCVLADGTPTRSMTNEGGSALVLQTTDNSGLVMNDNQLNPSGH